MIRKTGHFEAIARAMARNHQIKVIPSGAECLTDGENILIPFNSDHFDEASANVLHGLLDHEVGHVKEERRHKDAGRKSPLEILKSAKSDKERLVFNAFEDIRIERSESQQFIGVAENLAAASRHEIQRFKDKYAAEGGLVNANFWHTFVCAIIATAQGDDVSWIPSEYNKYLAVVSDEIAASNSTSWGQETHQLAVSVVKKIEKFAEEQKQKLEAEEKEDSEDLSASKPSEGGDEQGKSKAGGLESETQKQDDGELIKIEVAEGALGESDTADIKDETKERIKEMVRRDIDLNNRYIPHPAAVARDKVIKPLGDIVDYNRCRDIVSDQITGLRGKLLSLIRSRQPSVELSGRRHGKLDTRRLGTIASGNTNVFKVEIEGEKLDTAITVLIDMSGSMGSGHCPGHPAHQAKLMAIALAETFEALQIPFEVIGFETDTPERCVGKEEISDVYSRYSPMLYHEFKSFDQKHRTVKQRMSDIAGSLDNDDGEALLYAAKRLIQREESRKIMFVLSDGCPATRDASHERLNGHLVEAIQQAASWGIEMFGIGACSDHVEQFYTKKFNSSCIVVKDIKTLAVDVYKLMRDRLLSTNRSV